VYESWYGFTEKPFNLTPDPKYLYLSQRHAEAAAQQGGERHPGQLGGVVDVHADPAVLGVHDPGHAEADTADRHAPGPRLLAELLEQLAAEGPLSVYALAKRLQRDYKNVHTDVAQLGALGLIERSGARVAVPWDAVRAELRLSA